MALTTNVPPVTFGPNGFIVPAQQAVLSGVQADINQAFGGNLNFTTESGSQVNATPQNQLASSEAAIISNCYSLFQYYTNQVDPAYAQGRMQDAIARIYFLERKPAQSTTVLCTVTGLPGTVIPFGSTAQDTSGNLYTAQADTTIPSTGNAQVSFAAVVAGPTACPAGTLNQIYQAIPGWDTINNLSDGVLGSNTESRAAFEARRAASTAQNSVGSLPSVLGSVLSVSGVTDAYVTENATGSPVTVLGYTLAPNSLYVAVAGGGAADVAKAIWTKKAPGCAYNGNTTVAVQDTNSGYSPPLPSYNVTFETPTPLTIIFSVNLVSSPEVPSNAATLVRNAIINAFAGGDGGPRARIGGLLLASRFYAPITALGPWAQIRSLQIGSVNTPSALFTASIAGTSLNVTAVTSGTLAVGQSVFGTGVSSGSGVLDGTTILSQSSGSVGGIGAYVVSITQNVVSSMMTSALANQNQVQVNINQVPVVAAADITVTTS